MKNIVVTILAGISVILAVSLFYQNRKDLATTIEGLGNMSYAQAREKAAEAADQKKDTPIKIAVLGNGSDARFRELLKGVRLASTELNAKGGVNGRKVEIVFKDDKGSLPDCKVMAQELAADTSVTALICGFNYMEFRSVVPICEYNQMLLVSPVITSGLIADQGDLEMVYTNYPDINSMIDVMFKFLKKNNLKSTAIISPPEYYYGYYFANAFDRHFSGGMTGAGRVVRRDLCYENAPLLLKKTFRVWDPRTAFDNMLICGNNEIVRNVIPLARELSPDAVYLLTDEMERRELFEDDLGGLKVFLPSVYDPGNEKEANKAFRENFNKVQGYFPEVWAAQGFDTLNLIAAVMKKTASTVPGRLSYELWNNKMKFTGNVSSAPYIAFDDDGLLIGSDPVIKYPVKDGFKVLKSLDIKDMEKTEVPVAK